MKEPPVSRVLRFSLYAVLVTGILITVSLPLMLDTYFRILHDTYYPHSGYRVFITVFLMFAGTSGTWVVWEMIMMMRSIPANPFVLRNVRALKRVGFIFAVLSAAFLIKCFVYITFLTMVSAAVFILACLFAFTLANLFSQAVALREENDLTI